MDTEERNIKIWEAVDYIVVYGMDDWITNFMNQNHLHLYEVDQAIIERERLREQLGGGYE